MTEQTSDTRRVRVASVRREAIDVLTFELVPIDGRPLLPCEPGAHIDVHVPGGLVRQYSLCSDLGTGGRYTIAVKREPSSRGGSAAMHERVAAGAILAIAGPRNNFPLAHDARHSLFIAGGIGITPIHAMVHSLHAAGQDWDLHYCARSENHAAFHRALHALAPTRVHTYFSEEPILDVANLTRKHEPGTHLYCCGPKGLMDAVAESTAHWPADHVHFEWFSAPAIVGAANREFEIVLKRSGVTLNVPADRSILQVLRDHGFDVASSCEEGVCGTCETRVLSGEPEHRDALLSPAERAANNTMMICISRARSGRLVLDL